MTPKLALQHLIRRAAPEMAQAVVSGDRARSLDLRMAMLLDVGTSVGRCPNDLSLASRRDELSIQPEWRIPDGPCPP